MLVEGPKFTPGKSFLSKDKLKVYRTSDALHPQSTTSHSFTSRVHLGRHYFSRDILSRVSVDQKPVIAIVGPTASGKSMLGIEVALELNGEIINCDSVPPQINYTAGEWARAAADKIDEIESRGHVPLLVGGTGFYLRTLRQPLF